MLLGLCSVYLILTFLACEKIGQRMLWIKAKFYKNKFAKFIEK